MSQSTEPAVRPPLKPAAGKPPTRISSLYVGLVIAAAVLVLVVVFLMQNSRSVDISFFGAHVHASLAVAMLTAALVGALIVAAAGTARITQLRRTLRTSKQR